MNMRHNVTVQDWKSQDAEIVSKCINHFGFSDDVRFLAYRESCRTVMKIWKQFQHHSSKYNILVDPVFAFDDVNPIEAPYGAQQDWFDELPGMQASKMVRYWSKVPIGIWILKSKRGDRSLDGGRRNTEVIAKCAETFGLDGRLRVHEVTKEFLCETAAGLNVQNVLMILVCKYFRDAFCEFLSGRSGKAPPQDIPSWALEVASTVASSPTGSKSLPPMNVVDVQTTIHEVAEVLENESMRGGARPTSAASGQDQEMLKRRTLPQLMGNRPSSRTARDNMGSRGSSRNSRRPSRSLPALVPGQKIGQRMPSLPQSSDGFKRRLTTKEHKERLASLTLAKQQQIQNDVLAKTAEMSMSMTQFANSTERVKSRNELAVQRNHSMRGMLNKAANRLNPFQDKSSGSGQSASLPALNAPQDETPKQPEKQRKVRKWGPEKYHQKPCETTQAEQLNIKNFASKAKNLRGENPTKSQSQFLMRNCKMVRNHVKETEAASETQDLKAMMATFRDR